MDSSNSNDRSRLSTKPREDDPGAYPFPFRAGAVELGSRLDSIPSSLRFWAVHPERAGMRWYNDIVEANNRYEEWLTTQPPGEYPVPFNPKFGGGKRLDELWDSSRNWGAHPDRSSFVWYNFFKRANDRYEQHLAATREPGEFRFPPGNNRKYTGMPIKDAPQDVVWWALRPSNRHKVWYQPMYDDNKRMLDKVYQSRSPGSEPIWFGVRYRGLRLDQLYERKGFMRWFLALKREHGWIYRFKDLIERLKEWRRVHPERSGPRQRRKTPDIQDPVGEAIGPWDDSPGSADEYEYEKDSFIQSDSDELEHESDHDDELMDNNPTDNHPEDSDGSTSSSVTTPSVRCSHKRKRTNVIMSDDEESEVRDVSVSKLGKQYRVQHENSDL